MYIVLAALLASSMSPYFLINRNPVGFLLPAVGCVVGALIYRYRSRRWPIDPTARMRIVKYSLISVTVPPALIFLLTDGGRAQGFGMVVIGLIVGASVAAGIILAGSHRDAR